MARVLIVLACACLLVGYGVYRHHRQAPRLKQIVIVYPP